MDEQVITGIVLVVVILASFVLPGLLRRRRHQYDDGREPRDPRDESGPRGEG